MGTSLRRFKSDLVYRVGSLPRIKKLFRYWYPYMSRRLRSQDVNFFNWGYEEDPPMQLALNESDEPNRYCIQLYHRTAAQHDLTGSDVLEVSCGHGGGASYVTRTLKPSRYIGLDLNADGVQYCSETHVIPGLNFVQGDAEELPFDDQQFDVVLNVEASHIYPDFTRFLAEVVRVLKPGGHFLYTDMRNRLAIAEWESDLANSPLRLVSQTEINAEVLRGLIKNSAHTSDLVRSNLPKIAQRFGSEFAVVEGSLFYEGLREGSISYRVYHFAKD